MGKAWSHLRTIQHHRKLVRRHCFQVGLYKQGLLHDLSKYSPVEFRVGARYFQGNQSPNNIERKEQGYSSAWLHHKGRNRHHYEYWTDMSKETWRYEGVPMPRKYLVEMVMDRRSLHLIEVIVNGIVVDHSQSIYTLVNHYIWRMMAPM